VDTFDIIIAISDLEIALKKFGTQVQLGKGVAAAQEILLEKVRVVLNDIKEEGLEMALKKFGGQVQYGKGVAAA
jgi:aspartate aminotransferase-like enzyme